MRRTKILPAILAIVPATVLLTAQASLSAPAADDCKIKPGLSTPAGEHWFYRINRADKRHCWYLGAAQLHVRHADRASEPAPAEDATSVAVAPPVAAAEETASAAAAPQAASAIPPLPPAEQTGQIDFSARWPRALPLVEDADSVEPPAASNSYAEAAPATETESKPQLRWPVAETAGVRASSTGEIALDYISLAGLIATGCLLLAGWAVRFARRPVRHDQPRPLPALAIRRPIAGAERQRRRAADATATPRPSPIEARFARTSG